MDEPSPAWLLAAAVDGEIRGVRRALDAAWDAPGAGVRAWTGTWQGAEWLLLKTGVGPNRTRRTVRAMLARRRPAGILSIGYCGALAPGLRVGDICLPAEIQGIAPLPGRRFLPDERLLRTALESAASGPWCVHTGRMITADRVIYRSEEKLRMGAEHDAASVEMESAVVAEAAEAAGIPFLVARVVLDEASLSFPDTLEMGRWLRAGRLDRVAGTLLRPSNLRAFGRLWRRSRQTSAILTRFLLEGLLETLTEGG